MLPRGRSCTAPSASLRLFERLEGGRRPMSMSISKRSAGDDEVRSRVIRSLTHTLNRCTVYRLEGVEERRATKVTAARSRAMPAAQALRVQTEYDYDSHDQRAHSARIHTPRIYRRHIQ